MKIPHYATVCEVLEKRNKMLYFRQRKRKEILYHYITFVITHLIREGHWFYWKQQILVKPDEIQSVERLESTTTRQQIECSSHCIKQLKASSGKESGLSRWSIASLYRVSQKKVYTFNEP